MSQSEGTVIGDEKKKQGRRWALIIGGIALTAVAAVVASKVTNNVANRAYKSSGPTADIDFDDMGPEIVRKDSADKE